MSSRGIMPPPPAPWPGGGGHIARVLGDGLLVYLGRPSAREDDPERADRAGLAIVEATATLDAGDGTRLAVRRID
jgi:class 3 adenylate cyclase